MNRLLLVLNVCLALALGYRLLVDDAQAAAGPAETWTLADVRERARTYGHGHKRLSRLLLDLGRAVERAAPADLGLRLEPDFDCRIGRVDGRLVELLFASALPPGQRFTVHSRAGLRAEDGALSLPAGPLFRFETPAVDLDSVVIDERDDGDVGLLVRFDLPVDLAAVRAHLRLRPVDAVEELPLVIDALDSGQDFRVTAAPGRALPDHVDLLVAPGLLARGAQVGTGAATARRIAVRGPLHLTEATVREGAVELAFNRSFERPAEGLVRLEPAQPFELFSSHDGVRLVGAFAPGTALAVVLDEGFPGHGRFTLRGTERRSLLVPDRRPSVRFAQAGSVISARAEPTIDVATVNVERFGLRLRRVYPNNVVRMLQRGDDRAMTPAVETEIVVEAARNETATTRLDLRELLDDPSPRGLVHLRIWDPDQGWWGDERLLQLTDLGVSLRAAPDAAAVQVVSIADATPVADAAVEVLSPTNQQLAEGRTDADGLAMLRWAADGADREAFIVAVRTADDQAFVDLDSCGVELADPTLGGRPYTTAGAEAWLWPSRGIVRPGETLETVVLVRDAAGRAVAGREIEVRYQQPNGRIWRRETQTTPGSGMLTARLETSLDAPVGTWTLRVHDLVEGFELGQVQVQVEAFVPLRLEAEVEALDPLRFGAVSRVRVQGRWLDGSPASGREVELRVRLIEGGFAPDGAEGFSFASGTEEPPPGELPALRGVLDAEGLAEFRVPLPAAKAHQTLGAQLLAEVIDPSGRAVRAADRQPVLRPDFQLGIAVRGTAVELRAVGPDGAAFAGTVEARVRLERRQWRWSYRSLSAERWRWETAVESVVLGEWPVTIEDGAASLGIELPSVDQGWLAVVATVGADLTAVATLGQGGERPDRLRVRGPAEAVAPGGVATIAVDAPAAGRGFVTLEGPSLLSTQVVELAQGPNEIPVPVPADLALPNLHVVVTLTRAARAVGPDAGPAWLCGGTAIRLLRPDLAGTVTVTAPEQVLPEAELPCEILAPGASSAIVAVVDEGVLAITGHADPDPLAALLARRRIAARGADSFAALLERARYVPGTKTGGDDGDLLGQLAVGAVSPRIRPLALFAEVPLDADGRGTVRFTLPAYEGRVRVMAVVAGPQTCAAVARPTVVRAPLGLQLAAPRMVAPGDRFAVPVTVHNDTGRDGPVALRFEAAGGLELVDPEPRSLALASGASQSIDLEVRALAEPDEPGAARIHAEARCGDDERRVSIEVELRRRVLPQLEQIGLRLDAVQQVRIAEDFVAEGLRAELIVDALPDVHLRPALEALIEYPYGCVEQTTSRGIALLATAALLPRIYGGEAGAPDAAHFVQAAADRLVGMQHPGGGFGWWPGGGPEFGFGTVYATDFLLAARDFGCRVPDPVIDGALERVRAIAAADTGLSLRAFACEVLSRVGRAPRGLVDWLATQAPDLESRALLALALGRLGAAEAGRELLAGIEPDDGAPRQQGGTLGSALRSRALRFRALLALDPADPRLAAEAFGLQQALLAAGHLTTQEQGQTLRALAGWFATQRTDGVARLSGTLDGEVLPEPVDGRVTLAVRPGSVLALDGGGQGFGLLRVHGRRPVRPTEGDGSLSLTRRIFDPDSGEQVTRMRRGRVYEVRLSGRTTRPVENLVIVDLLPGGLEPEMPAPGAGLRGGVRRRGGDRSEVATDARIERRDDRVLLFRAEPVRGAFEFRHLVRATLPGRYGVEPPVAEAMYDPGLRFVGTADDGLEILP
jgi:uncharacterized protein YfaS (alpha-2-macroglobulin family)